MNVFDILGWFGQFLDHLGAWFLKAQIELRESLGTVM
jgi:hypothetical protein